MLYWHTLACVGLLLAWSYKQQRSRNRRHSQRTCGVCLQGGFAYYTFCGWHGWGTLCTRISHPRFSLHIPPPRLGEIDMKRLFVEKFVIHLIFAKESIIQILLHALESMVAEQMLGFESFVTRALHVYPQVATACGMFCESMWTPPAARLPIICAICMHLHYVWIQTSVSYNLHWHLAFI